jgi:hypothetical protein
VPMRPETKIKKRGGSGGSFGFFSIIVILIVLMGTGVALASPLAKTFFSTDLPVLIDTSFPVPTSVTPTPVVQVTGFATTSIPWTPSGNIIVSEQATTRVPPPTKTYTPTQTTTSVPCYLAKLVGDSTVPDGTPINPGASFIKTWQLRNEGSCTWDSGYRIVFVSGELMSDQKLFPWTGGAVGYGDGVEVSVKLVAPYDPGTYQSDFKLLAPDGTYIGLGVENTAFWTRIVVPSIATTTAPDWEGPYPPTTLYPANYSAIGCSSMMYLTLAWKDAYDESGISQYEVLVEVSIDGKPWDTVGTWPTAKLSQDIEVSCGYSYRWSVRAQDTAQNWGGYGDYQYFDMEVPG